MSKVGVFILMFGNTALSLNHVYVLDNYSPWAFNGYTDSIFCAGSFLVFLVWFLTVIKGKGKPLQGILIPFIFGISWNLAGAHNIVIVSSLLILLLMISLFRKDVFPFKRILFVSIALWVSVLVGIPMGGLLTPKEFQDTLGVENMAMPYTSISIREKSEFLNIMPGLPYIICLADPRRAFGPRHFTGWPMTPAEVYFANQNYGNTITMENIYFLVSNLEDLLWASFRITFFSLLGIILLRLSLLKGKTVHNFIPAEKEYVIDLKYLSNISIITFLTGFGIVFPFSFYDYGYKHTMSRFLTLGYLLGTINFIIWFAIFFEKVRSKIILIAFVTIITIGPMIDYLAMTSFNVNNKEFGYPFRERLEWLITFSGFTGENKNIRAY
ncbi:MAG: hypothetical protein HY754_06135 [Nitrospirae bacterium]|nr:hypothetical protein [Nitrospirota bacterium]